MRHVWKAPSEYFVACSKRIVLDCVCGEKTILLGREEDWHWERRTFFECECGEMLSIGSSRISEEEVLSRR